MRVLVACEFSGLVRDAFIAAGHDAMSCDLEPSERPGPHHQGDVTPLLGAGWDLLIGHPPCQYLAASGARWWSERQAEQRAAIEFFMLLARAPIPRKAIENPIGCMSTHWRKPDQTIQPWQYGHLDTKATCLWLSGLPLLVPTDITTGRASGILDMHWGTDRAKNRSRTYSGIAAAMAAQWGSHAM